MNIQKLMRQAQQMQERVQRELGELFPCTKDVLPVVRENWGQTPIFVISTACGLN